MEQLKIEALLAFKGSQCLHCARFLTLLDLPPNRPLICTIKLKAQLSSINLKMYFFAREKGLDVGRAGKYKKEAQQARHLGEVCSQNFFFAWRIKNNLDPPRVMIVKSTDSLSSLDVKFNPQGCCTAG